MSRTFAFLQRKSLQDLVAGLTPRALFPLALAIFCLFSIVGLRVKDLADAADRPLREIADRLVAAAHAHGPQLDDQTLLLVRRL